MTKKTSKIVTLPNTFEPHDKYDDGRRTFIYLVPTDTLYIAPNNAYHRDIWDWLSQNKSDEYEQLWSDRFKDAFKEGSVALGLFDRNYDDHSLEARTYWAEGNDDLPDHIINELSNYMGEKVYVRPWEYPQDWTQIVDMPDYDDEEPTKQWPTDSLDAITHKHNTMAESLPSDEHMAAGKHPLRLVEAQPGDAYRTWSGGISTYIPGNGDHVWNVIEDDPEYVQEFDEPPIIGSINYHEKTDGEIHVEEIFVDRDYRNTNAFYMLAQPLLALNKPISADFANERLQDVFVKLWQRRKIPVSPSFEPASSDDIRSLHPQLGFTASLHGYEQQKEAGNVEPADISSLDVVKDRNNFAFMYLDGTLYVGSNHRRIINAVLGQEAPRSTQHAVFGWADRTGEWLDDPYTDWRIKIMSGSFWYENDARPELHDEALAAVRQFVENSLGEKVAGVQPVELMSDEPSGVMYWANGGGTGDLSRARTAWAYHDGSLYVGLHHRDIMGSMRQEGIDPRYNTLYGWIDPVEDGKPWATVTDTGWQDNNLLPQVQAFFKQYPPQAVLNYIRTGELTVPPDLEWLDHTGEERITTVSTDLALPPDGSGSPEFFAFLYDPDKDTLLGQWGGIHRILGPLFVENFGDASPRTVFGWMRNGQVHRHGIEDVSPELKERVRALAQERTSSLWKRASEVEFVSTRPDDRHGMGLPWMYIPNHDTLYVGTTRDFHRELIRSSPSIQDHMHEQEYGDYAHPADDYLAGRIDEKGNATIYQLSDIADVYKDKAIEALREYYPEIKQYIDQLEPDIDLLENSDTPMVNVAAWEEPWAQAWIYTPQDDRLHTHDTWHRPLLGYIEYQYGYDPDDRDTYVYGWYGRNADTNEPTIYSDNFGGNIDPKVQERAKDKANQWLADYYQRGDKNRSTVNALNHWAAYKSPAWVYDPETDRFYVGDFHRQIIHDNDLRDKFAPTGEVGAWSGEFFETPLVLGLYDPDYMRTPEISSDYGKSSATYEQQNRGLALAMKHYMGAKLAGVQLVETPDDAYGGLNGSNMHVTIYDPASDTLYVNATPGASHRSLLREMANKIHEDEYGQGWKKSKLGFGYVDPYKPSYQNYDVTKVEAPKELFADAVRALREQLHIGKTARIGWEFSGFYFPDDNSVLLGNPGDGHTHVMKAHGLQAADLKSREFVPFQVLYEDATDAWIVRTGSDWVSGGRWDWPDDSWQTVKNEIVETYNFEPDHVVNEDEYEVMLDGRSAHKTAGIQVVPVEPTKEGVSGVPFLYEVDTDTLYVATAEVSHRTFIKYLPQDVQDLFVRHHSSSAIVNGWITEGYVYFYGEEEADENDVSRARTLAYDFIGKTAGYEELSPGRAEDIAAKRYITLRTGETIYGGVHEGTHRRLMKDNNVKSEDIADAGYVMPDGSFFSFMEHNNAFAPYIKEHPSYRPEGKTAAIDPQQWQKIVQQYPYAYHTTHPSRVPQIMQQGLLPPSQTGQWSMGEDAKYSPDSLYLSVPAPGTVGEKLRGRSQIAVDMSKLDPKNIEHDFDFEGLGITDPASGIAQHGTFTHRGPIPADSLTRLGENKTATSVVEGEHNMTADDAGNDPANGRAAWVYVPESDTIYWVFNDHHKALARTFKKEWAWDVVAGAFYQGKNNILFGNEDQLPDDAKQALDAIGQNVMALSNSSIGENTANVIPKRWLLLKDGDVQWSEPGEIQHREMIKRLGLDAQSIVAGGSIEGDGNVNVHFKLPNVSYDQVRRMIKAGSGRISSIGNKTAGYPGRWIKMIDGTVYVDKERSSLSHRQMVKDLGIDPWQIDTAGWRDEVFYTRTNPKDVAYLTARENTAAPRKTGVSNPDVLGEGDAAWYYEPGTDEFYSEQDHPYIVSYFLAEKVGYSAEQISQIMDDYFDGKDSNAYYEMQDKAMEYAKKHGLFGWWSADGTPYLWSATQGMDASLLNSYGEKALERARREYPNRRAKVGTNLSMGRPNARPNPPTKSLPPVRASVRSDSRPWIPGPMDVAWMRGVSTSDPQSQAASLAALPNSTTHPYRTGTLDPHQTCPPRVPPADTGTLISKSHKFSSFSDNVSVVPTEKDDPTHTAIVYDPETDHLYVCPSGHHRDIFWAFPHLKKKYDNLEFYEEEAPFGFKSLNGYTGYETELHLDRVKELYDAWGDAHYGASRNSPFKIEQVERLIIDGDSVAFAYQDGNLIWGIDENNFTLTHPAMIRAGLVDRNKPAAWGWIEGVEGFQAPKAVIISYEENIDDELVPAAVKAVHDELGIRVEDSGGATLSPNSSIARDSLTPRVAENEPYTVVYVPVENSTYDILHGDGHYAGWVDLESHIIYLGTENHHHRDVRNAMRLNMGITITNEGYTRTDVSRWTWIEWYPYRNTVRGAFPLSEHGAIKQALETWEEPKQLSLFSGRNANTNKHGAAWNLRMIDAPQTDPMHDAWGYVPSTNTVYYGSDTHHRQLLDTMQKELPIEEYRLLRQTGEFGDIQYDVEQDQNIEVDHFHFAVDLPPGLTEFLQSVYQSNHESDIEEHDNIFYPNTAASGEPGAWEVREYDTSEDAIDDIEWKWSNNRRPVLFNPELHVIIVGSPGDHHRPLINILKAEGLYNRSWNWDFYLPDGTGRTQENEPLHPEILEALNRHFGHVEAKSMSANEPLGTPDTPDEIAAYLHSQMDWSDGNNFSYGFPAAVEPDGIAHILPIQSADHIHLYEKLKERGYDKPTMKDWAWGYFFVDREAGRWYLSEGSDAFGQKFAPDITRAVLAANEPRVEAFESGTENGHHACLYAPVYNTLWIAWDGHHRDIRKKYAEAERLGFFIWTDAEYGTLGEWRRSDNGEMPEEESDRLDAAYVKALHQRTGKVAASDWMYSDIWLWHPNVGLLTGHEYGVTYHRELYDALNNILEEIPNAEPRRMAIPGWLFWRKPLGGEEEWYAVPASLEYGAPSDEEYHRRAFAELKEGYGNLRYGPGEEGMSQFDEDSEDWGLRVDDHNMFPSKMDTLSAAVHVVYVPEGGPLIDSSRTPIVWDSKNNTVYIGDRGGTHPSLLSEAAGVVMHMSEVPLKKKEVYEQFAAGLYTPKDGGRPWTTAVPGYCDWFYGPKPPVDVDVAIENYVENEYVDPRRAPQQLEDWRQNRMADTQLQLHVPESPMRVVPIPTSKFDQHGDGDIPFFYFFPTNTLYYCPDSGFHDSIFQKMREDGIMVKNRDLVDKYILGEGWQRENDFRPGMYKIYEMPYGVLTMPPEMQAWLDKMFPGGKLSKVATPKIVQITDEQLNPEAWGYFESGNAFLYDPDQNVIYLGPEGAQHGMIWKYLRQHMTNEEGGQLLDGAMNDHTQPNGWYFSDGWRDDQIKTVYDALKHLSVEPHDEGTPDWLPSDSGEEFSFGKTAMNDVFHSWVYIPEHGGFRINDAKWGNHRQLFQAEGITLADLKSGKLGPWFPGQIWVNDEEKQVWIEPVSDYIEGLNSEEGFGYNWPDYFSNLVQKGQEYAAEWAREHYPDYAIHDTYGNEMKTASEPIKEVRVPVTVRHSDGDYPFVYIPELNTMYITEIPGFHRDIFRYLTANKLKDYLDDDTTIIGEYCVPPDGGRAGLDYFHRPRDGRIPDDVHNFVQNKLAEQIINNKTNDPYAEEPRTAAFAPAHVKWIGEPSRMAIWVWHIPANSIYFASRFQTYHRTIMRELEPEAKIRDSGKLFLLGELDNVSDGVTDMIEVLDRNSQPYPNPEVAEAVVEAYKSSGGSSLPPGHPGITSRMSTYYHFIEEPDAESRFAGLPFVITHEDQVIVSDDPEEHHRQMMKNIGGSAHDIATAGVIYPDGTFTILWDTVSGDIDEIQDLLNEVVPDSVWSGEGYGLDMYSAAQPAGSDWDGSWFYLPDTDELFATEPSDKDSLGHQALIRQNPKLRQRLREEPFVSGWYTYPFDLQWDTQNHTVLEDRGQGIKVVPWGSDWLENQTGYTDVIDSEGRDDESVVPRVVELSKKKFPHYHFTG